MISPVRHVGYVTVEDHGARVQREVALELRHWRTLYDALMAAENPLELADSVSAQALTLAPQDLQAGLEQVLDGWFQAWPQRLGQVS